MGVQLARQWGLLLERVLARLSGSSRAAGWVPWAVPSDQAWERR
jgi:hypothetical protein